MAKPRPPKRRNDNNAAKIDSTRVKDTDKTVRELVGTTKQFGPKGHIIFKDLAPKDRLKYSRAAMARRNGQGRWKVAETEDSYLYQGVERGKRVYKRATIDRKTGKITRERVKYSEWKSAVQRVERNFGGYLMHSEG